MLIGIFTASPWYFCFHLPLCICFHGGKIFYKKVISFLQCVNNNHSGASGPARIQNCFKIQGLLFGVHGDIIADISFGTRKKP